MWSRFQEAARPIALARAASAEFSAFAVKRRPAPGWTLLLNLV